MDRDHIIETVDRLFIATDQHDWNALFEIFDAHVLLDYTSMVGGQPATLDPAQIISSWKRLLPGFDHTHHQTGNHIVHLKNEDADVFCYGTATHYLENESNSNVWIVVGSYDFHLKKQDGRWKVSRMKFNLKYLDGNSDLPGMAQKRIPA